MTHRERWLRCLHFEEVDHVPDEEFGYWNETFVRWHDEGLPEEIDNNSIADPYFRFAPRMRVPVNTGLLPSFERIVLEERGNHTIIRDTDGATKEIPTDGSDTIPKFVKFPIETREDWEKFKERLDPTDPARYPDNWDEHVERLNNADVPVVIHCGSLYGRFRDWMGFEGISIACMDKPDLVQDMMEYWVYFIETLHERAVNDIEKIDAGAFWEDMCFNKGCMISPKMFREWMTPRYKRITDFIRQAGADIFYVDCDGNIMEVVECWLDGGVNTMFPVEVAAGSDPFKIRKQWGERVKMLGGVNKRSLAKGKAAIEEELQSLVPLVEKGGMIPHVDHRCPPTVSYDDYLYYLSRKRELLGIPDPGIGLPEND